MRLIDADALRELIDGGFDIDFDETPELKAELLNMIDYQETIDAAPVAYDVEALRDFAVFVGWSIFDDELDGFFCEAACRKLYKLGIVSKNEENWAAGPEIIEKSREMGGGGYSDGVF